MGMIIPKEEKLTDEEVLKSKQNVNLVEQAKWKAILAIMEKKRMTRKFSPTTPKVVYFQKSKGNTTSSASLQPKPTSESLTVDVETNKDKAEKQEEEVLNIEGATEDGIKSVTNFLKDKIPGLNVKITNFSMADQVVEDKDAMTQLTPEDRKEDDDMGEVEGDTDGIRMELETMTLMETGKT